MPLLNYTTQISAEKTAAEIQAILARAGAMAIMTEYDPSGVLIGISFKIGTPFGPTAFSLPCDIAAVNRILDRQSRQGKVPKRLVSNEQAARVGWRIIKNWIEAQLALVQTQMVTLDQVFLPYARTRSGETVYERYIGTGLAGLAIEAPKCGPHEQD